MRPARRTGRRRQDEARDESIALAERRGWRHAVVRVNRSVGRSPSAFRAAAPGDARLDTRGPVGCAARPSEAIAASVGDTTLLLIVDDAQELDDASAAPVSLLTASDRIFLVVTVRTEEPPPPESLTARWKDELIVRVEVPELTQEAATELVSEAVGGPVDGATMQTLHTTSGGNVLFLSRACGVARSMPGRSRRPTACGACAARCRRRRGSARSSACDSAGSTSTRATHSRW